MRDAGDIGSVPPSFPRVLVVCGEPFNLRTATGITMSNLFQGWPRDRIAQIYSSSMDPDLGVCSLYWKLSAGDQRFVGALARMLGSPRVIDGKGARGSSDAQGPNPLGGSAMARMVRRASVLLDFFPYQLPDVIREGVNRFRPDVIYSILGSSRVVRLVSALSDDHEVPVVPHFMDDWLTTYTSSRPIPLLTPILKRELESFTAALLSRCPRGLGISDVMCEEYSEKFGIPFEAVMNPVNLPSPERLDRKDGAPFRFVYIGGLHLGRSEQLEDIATAISDLRSKSTRVELHVYAPNAEGRALADSIAHLDGCIVHPAVQSSEVQEILMAYDAAVHVESFDAFYSNYTRLSISTKIPQYLAAGLPILAYSPGTAASARYVGDNGCGIVVDVATTDDLQLALSTLIVKPGKRGEMSLRARRLAESRHDARLVCSNFARTLDQSMAGARV